MDSALFAALNVLFDKLGVVLVAVLVFLGERPSGPILVGGSSITIGAITIVLF